MIRRKKNRNVGESVKKNSIKGFYAILLFILLCFIGCTILYEIKVDSIYDSSIKNSVSENLVNTKNTIENKILEYRVNINSLSEASLKPGQDNLFQDRDYVISDSSVEINADNNYYVYFKDNTTYKKVLLSDVLNNLDLKINAIFISNEDLVYASTPSYLNTDRLLSTILSKSGNSSSLTDELRRNKDEFYYSKASLLVSGNESVSGYLGSTKFSDLRLTIMVSNDLLYINTTSLNTIQYVYYAFLAFVLILSAVVVIVMIKKASHSGGDSYIGNAKGANIVLTVTAGGRILKFNRAYKVSFLPGGPVKSLAEMKVLNSEFKLKDLIKDCKSFKLMYEEKVDEEGNLISPVVYFDFYALKKGANYVLVGKNITEEYKTKLKLVEVSTKSLITGDDNSFVLERRYQELKQRFLNVGDKYTIIMTDFKGFKDVNFLLGYKAGNEVLKYYSKYLHDIFEGYEIYHITADEFVIVTTTKTDKEINDAIDSLITGLKAPIKFNSNEIILRPAIGIFESAMDIDSIVNYDVLMDKLREATIKAKDAAGKNVCKYDANLENAAQKKREMEEDLKKAIANGEFVMFYQPQYELSEERVCGFEALLRWNNPKYASISPEVYIKMAEKNGYIIDVGHFITRDVFKTAKEMEMYNIHISVNVSPAQIVQAGFVSEFLDEFEKNDLKPGSIALEVTETFLMENFQSVVEKLKILKNRGISVHLDDFGTGYSSMLYLKELPIDTIKVDKEFIKHIETDRFSKVLTSKIISLGKELGTTVIVEGVETKVQKDIVGKFGADVIQGYYIGKALSKDDAFLLLKTGKVSSENKSNGKRSEE